MVSEHNVTLIERFYDMYNGNNGIYFIDKSDDNRFIQNQCIELVVRFKTADFPEKRSAAFGCQIKRLGKG